MLKRMGRHWYTAERYADAVEALVADAPGVFGLGADVIAGFPGETDADHRSTVALIERLPFTALHVFPYSPRPGTAATRLDGQVRRHVVAERAAELRALAAAKARRHEDRRAGGMADVIALEAGPDGRRGVTEDYLTIFLANPSVPRGTRWRARLVRQGTRLIATTP
jgi:threonylcarbamoyladenosine tRNA methylthiotransferase MtaB